MKMNYKYGKNLFITFACLFVNLFLFSFMAQSESFYWSTGVSASPKFSSPKALCQYRMSNFYIYDSYEFLTEDTVQCYRWDPGQPHPWGQGYRFGNTCPGVYDSELGTCNSIKEQGGAGCPEKTGETNPINLSVGNKYQVEIDYIGSDIFPIVVSRTFNSLGLEWSFFPKILMIDNNQTRVIHSDGKGYIFTLSTIGDWTPDPDVRGTLKSIKDSSGKLIGWRYTKLNQQIEDYNASGQLTTVTHRSGLFHTYSYTAIDITVTSSQGGTITYYLDENKYGRITGFTDPDNNQYTYGYDLQGRLTSITYPNSGGSRIYHYEDTYYPNALTGITDANGDRFATWTYDSQGRAKSSEHNNGIDKVTIDYTYLDDATDPRATATNPLGKQTTYHFTTIHGVRKVTQVEGHQATNCAAANKAYTYFTANGFLETKTDWQSNVTRYTRNAKGQELTRIEAENTAVERTITTDWHTTFNVPTKITESERETTFTYDGNGNQLTRVISKTAP